MTLSLEVVPAGTWPAWVAAELAERLRVRPDLRLVLPTGETPGPVYEALVALAGEGRAPFADAHVILLDEYLGLPSDDPALGGPRLRRELLDRLARPPAFTSIDSATSDPEGEATRLDDVAASGVDIALLGLGLNGHIGMNEPGSTADSPTRVVRLDPTTRDVATERYGATRPPTAGITLGIARLLQADEIWLLVSGTRKADVLARALAEPEGPDCPATYLRRHPRLRVMADADAATGLDRLAAGANG
jgi:glucosamine-6-phosphate deaminase